MQMRDEDRADVRNRGGRHGRDDALQGPDARLEDRIREEPHAIELKAHGRVTQVLDPHPGAALSPAVSPALPPGGLRGVGIQPHAPIWLATAGAGHEIGPLGHLVLEPPDVGVLR